MPAKKQAQVANKKKPVEPFGKEVFTYDKARDEYLCPEGKVLTKKGIAFGGQE